jgi:hypothetical protein
MRSALSWTTLAITFSLAAAACGPSSNNGDDDDDGTDGGVVESCDPGASEACYTGPSGTNGVGPCQGGTRTCLDSGQWGACNGEVLPSTDVCGDGIDQNCDGTADNATDQDGDGFTNCDGDCCDSTSEGCKEPAKVGPGAIEVAGNELDDDCDGTVDNEIALMCDSGLASNSGAALDYAKAMDICATTTETDHHWGVISARFAFADGTGTPAAVQRSIRPDFGSTAVQHGVSMGVISTANAAATNHTNPGPAPWQSTSHGLGGNFPADWYAANNMTLPNAPGCPAPVSFPIPFPGIYNANDPIMLELRIRTPQNAQSFSLRTNFMSAEFPEYVCTEFNDFFVVLLDSTWNGTPANPADKNLAFYVNGQNMRYPVGVNLAHGNTGLFTVCQNGATGCMGTVNGNINTCAGSTELTGTGMELPEAGGSPCQASPVDQIGGGTGWLTTTGNVNGGEIITLRIAVWDTSDGAFDSVALFDAFEWSLDPSEPGTVIDVD